MPTGCTTLWTLRQPAPPAGRRQLADAITARAVAAGLPLARADAFCLGVHEALSNAVEHGHAGDPTRDVEVVLSRSATHLTCSIGDQALGGPRAAPREIGPRVADDTGGHGWALMLASADTVEVTHEEGATGVHLTVALVAGRATGTSDVER